MKNIIKKVREKITRKIYWLPESQVKLVSTETKKGKWRNESALMSHIIGSWFKK